MDFSITDEQEAVRELARQIFADRTSHERSKALETSGEWYDTDLWAELVKTNLASLSIPEAYGGGGFGMNEVCFVLEEAGRHVAPVPLLPTIVLGGLPIAEFGSEDQKRKWLTSVSENGTVLTAALSEVGSSDPTRPRVTATPDGHGWRLDGEKVCVPAAALAGAILVPAQTGDGTAGVFIVEPNASGVKIEKQIAINFEPQGQLTLSGVTVGADAVLGDPKNGAAIVAWILDRALLGLAALQLGTAESAMTQTAAYITERKQFGKPIGSFQAAQLRIADAFIDVEAARSVLQEAAWRVSAGLPAAAEIRAAKWWSAYGGDRVVHTAQHLHGGIGSDVDYPIHRYFLWAQQTGNALGGGHQQLAALGKLLVSDAGRQGV